MYPVEAPEYFHLKSIYGEAVAERYKNLVCSREYRATESEIKVHLERREWEERRGRPLSVIQKTEEPLPSCLNLAGVRLTSAKRKKNSGSGGYLSFTTYPQLSISANPTYFICYSERTGLAL